MLRSALLLLTSGVLLAAMPAPLAATEGLPTTCIIDGVVYDQCPGDEGGPPWGGGSGSLPLIKPDFGARGGGFQIAPSCLTPGRSFEAYAVIENFGGLLFTDEHFVQVDFYLVTPGTVGFASANLLGSTTIVFPEVTSAGLGEVGVLVSTSGELPNVAPGQYQLGIDIDVGNLVVELSEGNNRVVAGDVVAVGDCVDLVPALDGFSATSPVIQGETLTISGNVRNEGDAALVGPRSFAVRYRAVPEGGDELGGTVLGQVTVTIPGGSSLAPGAARFGPSLSLAADLPPGNYAIAADVDHGDDEGTVTEVDEENNSRLVGSVEVDARPPEPPDYVIAKAMLDPEKNPISAGFRLRVALQLKNLGGRSAPGYYPEVRIVASTDQVIGDADDVTLRDFPAAQNLFTFGSGTRLSGTVTFELPWPAELSRGDYAIGAIVDPQDQVAEQREDNNSAVTGGVRATVDCASLPTQFQARNVFEEVFTRPSALPVEPATHPSLAGQLCEFCFGCDLDIFTTETDFCSFGFIYEDADAFIRKDLLPAMQRACVTTLTALVTADPSAVLATYDAAQTFKVALRQRKNICDVVWGNSIKRRYCGCSNTQYLHWASAPHPGECGYLP